jgi:hypothetical protein
VIDDCTNTASCAQTIRITCPKICVTKEVACYLGTNAQGSEVCGAFSKFATGVEGDTQDPAFCYRIAVTNCGRVDLTNVIVFDDKFGDLTTNAFGGSPPVLPVGGAVSFEFKAELNGSPLANTNALVTNTVIASAQSALSGRAVTNWDFAVAQIIPAAMSAEQLYQLAGGGLTNCLYLSDLLPHVVVTYVTLHNNGMADLSNVWVTNAIANPCLVNAGPFTVPAGGSVTVPVCTNTTYTCSNTLSTLIVTADSYSLPDEPPLCARDIAGEPIIVRAEAPGCVQCTLPDAARVTGGGRQADPLLYPPDARYVTHGGQVGAPLGQANCTVTSRNQGGNPCIHGRWTHVRHAQGGSQGNFHARLFDTMACSCLDTNLGAGGAYGPGTVVNAVCNPNDTTAGPAPRRAPANKIAFTGIGDWADGKGGRVPQSVLFRVDLEDRGEPGGSHAHGGVAPADRYRIRIWVLSEDELIQFHGSGADPHLINFRNAISACHGINVRDGEDVPNGTAVFGVRPPDIDDGGELQRGNVQIHPMIKNCSSTTLLLLE